MSAVASWTRRLVVNASVSWSWSSERPRSGVRAVDRALLGHHEQLLQQV